MREKLVERLEDIPGVESVSFNLEDVETGINVKLEEDADEPEVLERVRALLVAYGVRSLDHPTLQVGQSRLSGRIGALGVEVLITPIKGGARVEVIGRAIRSFRVVPPIPTAVAQGLTDAWCQVVGRIPLEITNVTVGDDGVLHIVATDGEQERVGMADVHGGWSQALTLAVGKAIGVVDPDFEARDANLTQTRW